MLGTEGARRQARQAVGRALSAQAGGRGARGQERRGAGGAGVRHKRAAGVGARGAARRGRAGARGACGWAHGRAGHDRLGGTGAQPVRIGWASWVLMHPAWFSTWFFDSVFFLSH